MIECSRIYSSFEEDNLLIPKTGYCIINLNGNSASLIFKFKSEKSDELDTVKYFVSDLYPYDQYLHLII